MLKRSLPLWERPELSTKFKNKGPPIYVIDRKFYFSFRRLRVWNSLPKGMEEAKSLNIYEADRLFLGVKLYQSRQDSVVEATIISAIVLLNGAAPAPNL